MGPWSERRTRVRVPGLNEGPTVRAKKNFIVWSRPLCDRCVSVAEPSLNRSISAVGVYKRGVRRYTIIGATQLSRALQRHRI